MNQPKQKFTVNFGIAKIDPYPIPPYGVFTECDIQWTLAQAVNKKQRKYYAAMIILGQPFNYIRKQDKGKLNTSSP